MATKKDSTIFYQDQIEICRKHFNAEQFGRLMLALFEVEEGNDPEVALQKKIDRKKYDELCERNRKNGAKGGRPKKNPEKANGFFKNPNENDKRMIRDNNDNDKAHDDFGFFGTFDNVELTETERNALTQTYERSEELIDKVSIWLRGAAHDVPDHYGLCVKFANNDKWPRRKVIEPVEIYEPEDPLTEEEQDVKVAEMRARLNEAFEAG